MARFFLTGFMVGALLGAYGNAFGFGALGWVLLAGVVGTLTGGGAFLATKVDRARLKALLGELTDERR